MSFKLSNGESFENKHDYQDRPFLRVLVGRVQDDGTTLVEMTDEVKDMPDERATDTLNMINIKTDKRYSVTDTYLLAKNENFKEYPPLAAYLDDGFASNCDYFHKIELHFVTENYQRKIYMDWRGNQNLLSFMSGLDWSIEEAIREGKFDDQGFRYDNESDVVHCFFWNLEGNVIDVELEIRELIEALAGVRVVEFSETITSN